MRPVNRTLAGLLIGAAVLAAAGPAVAQSADNVLVVVNDASAASQRVAEYYVQKRGIPAVNVVHLKTAVADEVTRAAFATTIELPISIALSRNSLQDRILYIVLTKGVPLRVKGTPGRNGTIASVDSELALLYRKMTGVSILSTGPIPNPYFAGDRTDVRPLFSHAAQDIYLVTRLDGFTVADAVALVDRSLAATGTAGTIVLDERGGSADKANDWLAAAAARLRALHWDERLLFETTTLPAKPSSAALGYYSFGSNDPSSLGSRVPAVEFAPGALAAMFLSADARTLAEPPAQWKPGPLATMYAGSNQSLTGDLLRGGATGAAGQVSEPFLDGAVRPDILFPAYVSGLNLAEAFYSAIPSLSWQTVVFGDPLCAPFRTASVPERELNPGVDPETELPAQFSERRLNVIAPNATGSVRKLLLRADALGQRGDTAGAIGALERATAADATLRDVFRVLGTLYEQAGQFDKARGAYERALKNNPNDIVALNNLAYGIAVRDHKPADALPMAERAFSLAGGSPWVADTLGWIKHLLGDDAAALPLLEAAANSDTSSAEMRVHLAVVYAARGRLQDAAKALEAARALDPAVEQRDDYRAAKKQIGGLSPGGGH